MRKLKVRENVRQGKIKEIIFNGKFIQEGDDLLVLTTKNGDVLVKSPFSGKVLRTIQPNKRIKRRTVLAYIIPENTFSNTQKQINEGTTNSSPNDIFGLWKTVASEEKLNNLGNVRYISKNLNNYDSNQSHELVNNKQALGNNKQASVNEKFDFNDFNQGKLPTLKPQEAEVNEIVQNESEENINQDNLLNLTDIKQTISNIRKQAQLEIDTSNPNNKIRDIVKNKDKTSRVNNIFTNMRTDFENRKNTLYKSNIDPKYQLIDDNTLNSETVLDRKTGQPNMFRNKIEERMHKLMASNGTPLEPEVPSNTNLETTEIENKEHLNNKGIFSSYSFTDNDNSNSLGSNLKNDSDYLINKYNKTIDTKSNPGYLNSYFVNDHNDHKTYNQRLYDRWIKHAKQFPDLMKSGNLLDQVKLRQYALEFGISNAECYDSNKISEKPEIIFETPRTQPYSEFSQPVASNSYSEPQQSNINSTNMNYNLDYNHNLAENNYSTYNKKNSLYNSATTLGENSPEVSKISKVPETPEINIEPDVFIFNSSDSPSSNNSSSNNALASASSTSQTNTNSKLGNILNSLLSKIDSLENYLNKIEDKIDHKITKQLTSKVNQNTQLLNSEFNIPVKVMEKNHISDTNSELVKEWNKIAQLSVLKNIMNDNTAKLAVNKIDNNIEDIFDKTFSNVVKSDQLLKTKTLDINNNALNNDDLKKSSLNSMSPNSINRNLNNLEVDNSLNIFNTIDYVNIIPKTKELKINVENLVQIQNKLEKIEKNSKLKFSTVSFVIKAFSIALKKNPDMNVVFNKIENKKEIKSVHNIGLATETNDGILIPVIKFVDKLSMKEAAINISETLERIRTNELFDYELYGSTAILSSFDVAQSNLKFELLGNVGTIIGLNNIRKIIQYNTKNDKECSNYILNAVVTINSAIISDKSFNNFIESFTDIMEHPSVMFL